MWVVVVCRSSGTGRAIALAFAADGANAVASSRIEANDRVDDSTTGEWPGLDA